MSYTVLARKYRSRTFDDLVGQDAIATTLKNAVSADRVHHGYLFTGTRGVGKTSTARVLAKALNCLKYDAPNATPCCECESCRMIAEGEDLDVIEIDAASNTGVDNIRDLRDNAAYRPARSRFKIYIIDEVHMLSTGAFNALLKTLEEPPDHVKFVLATTEVHKVPATIVSRCQRFDFRSIGMDDIAAHLKWILKQESIEADDAVIRRVARLANGSMRDGLSLLDQLLSFGSGQLTLEAIDDVLPPAHDERVSSLIEHVGNQDAAAALLCVEEAVSAGQTTERLCELIVDHLRRLMLLNVCGADTDLIDVPSNVHDRLVQQAQQFDAPTFVYLIGLMEEVRRAVKTSNASRALVDAAVVRMAMASKFSDIEDLIARLEGGSGDGGAKATPTAPAAQPAPIQKSSGSRTSRSKSPAPRSETGSASGKRRTRSATPSAAVSKPGPRNQNVLHTQASSADQDLVRRNPTIRKAMELFDGTLVSVQRTTPVRGESPATGAGAPDVNDALENNTEAGEL
jgi:DNA polymerase-3 subunit gamma/tau